MSYTNILKNELNNFSPAYFALVMATGIVATASQLLNYKMISDVLFILNNVFYLILLFIFIARLFLYFSRFKSDLGTHATGAGFLTLTAGSCILGTEYVQAKHLYSPAILLWIFALIAWVILLNSFLTKVILKTEKPSLEKGMNGSWLLLVVSTQSLAILGTLVAPHLPGAAHVILFAAIFAWLLGILLYVIFITIIIYRLTFYPVYPKEISPSYWIDTGAAAISALAGITIIGGISSYVTLQQFIPVVKMLSMLLWVSASWWLPLLFILEGWRHIKTGFKYSPGYWSLVFPLGMYTVATIKLSATVQVPLLNSFAKGFIFIAWAAWIITFVSMIFTVARIFLATDHLNNE